MNIRAVLLICLISVSGALSYTSPTEDIDTSNHIPLWNVGDYWEFQDYEFDFSTYYLNGTVIFDPVFASYNLTEIVIFEGIEAFRVFIDTGNPFLFYYYYSTSDFALLGVEASFETGGNRYDTKIPYNVDGNPYLNFSDFGEGSHIFDVNLSGAATVTNTTNPADNSTTVTNQYQKEMYNISSEYVTINGYGFDAYRVDSRTLEYSGNSTEYENGELISESRESREWFANMTGYTESFYSHDYKTNITTSTVDTLYHNTTLGDYTFWVSKRFGHIIMTETTVTISDSTTLLSVETVNGTTYSSSFDEIIHINGPNAGLSGFGNYYYSLYGDSDAPVHSSSTTTSTVANSTTTTETSTNTTISSTATNTTSSTSTTAMNSTTSSQTSTGTSTNSTSETSTTSSTNTTNSDTTSSSSSTSTTTTSEDPTSSTSTSETSATTNQTSSSPPEDSTEGNITSSSSGINTTEVTLPISIFAFTLSFVVIQILRRRNRSN